jgi:hypothetical protein
MNKLIGIWLCVLLFLIGAHYKVVEAGTTGKITGMVIDTETKESLPGANLIIEGTTMGAATDLDGYYVILNIPPGNYNLIASMIGYEKAKVL